jgi:hypothetical protein
MKTHFLNTALLAALVGLGLSCAERSGVAATNSVGLHMVPVPAGSFVMGEDTHGDWDERPAHRVVLTKGFQISASEVTLEQFQKFRPGHGFSHEGKATGVSWDDATAFCAWLSKKEGQPYRLPTEAEWEYACRAGTTNRFWSGAALPADTNQPNPWGLRGTHDGVMEWCSDWYGPYAPDEQTDPVGAASGMVRVVRGDKPDLDERLKDEAGRIAEDYHRSANRAGLPPTFGVPAGVVPSETNEVSGAHWIGFRVVRGEMPATKGAPVQDPFVRQGVRPPDDWATVGPTMPYFRKRHLLPIPPDNASDEAIAAAGFHPSFRKHNHSPALEVCPNGDVLLITYTSYFEYEPGVSLMAARLRFGQDEWDFPEPMFDTPDVNDHATMLWTDWERGGRMWFFWGWPKMSAGAYPFQWMTSDDSGATWSPVRFPAFKGEVGPFSRQPINTALRIGSTVLVASDAEKKSSVLWASEDEGKTWRDTGGRTAGRHTTFAALNNGSILGVGGKNSDLDGYMPKAISNDGGKSWEVSRTPFAAQGVNQRPSVLRLKSGRLLFAGDFQKRGNIAPEGITNRGCYVALSDDEGATWRIKPLPGAQPHEKPEYQDDPATLGYSAARQAPNGMIHLISTMTRPCLHFEFNEAWILSDRPDAGDDGAWMASKAGDILKLLPSRSTVGDLRIEWSGGVADDGRYLKEGTERWIQPDGKVRYEAAFTLGRKTGAEVLRRPDGTEVWRWDRRADGTATWTTYWENGTKRSESNWKGTAAHGSAKNWDRSGRLLNRVEFDSGSLN